MNCVHGTADIADSAKLGTNTYIWNNSQVRDGASIGDDCTIAKNVYIDSEVKIGNKVKIQNNCSIYRGVVIEDGVFIGPHVTFTNDKFPRAINFDGTVKKIRDWKISNTLVKYGASIGANATILCGVTLGKFCLIGSGSVVTKSVPDYALYLGNPAEFKAWVCKCGRVIKDGGCKTCNTTTKTINENTNK